MTLQLNKALERAGAPLVSAAYEALRLAGRSAPDRWVDLATCARGEAWHG